MRRPVVLAAHGAGDGSEANRRVGELATAVALRCDAEVQPAFWKGSPGFAEVARALADRAPVVVPVMASDGFYASRLLPERLSLGDPSRAFTLTPPLGGLAAFDGVVRRMVDAAVPSLRAGLEPPLLLLIGHGTTRVRSSGDVAHRVRRSLMEAHPDLEALAVFLDQPPYLGEVSRFLRDRPLLVVPLLMGGGPHVKDDLVRLLRADAPGSHGRGRTAPVEVLPPVLEWPELLDLTIEAIDLAPPADGSMRLTRRAR